MSDKNEDSEAAREEAGSTSQVVPSIGSTSQSRSTKAMETLQSTLEKEVTPKWQGSWRGKSNPVIGVALNDTASVRSLRSHTSRLMRAPSKSGPSEPSMTLLNVTSEPQDGVSIGGRDDTIDPSITKAADVEAVHETGQQLESSTEERPVDSTSTSAVSEDRKLRDRPLPEAKWGGWWTKSHGEVTANPVVAPTVAHASDVKSHDPTSSSILGRAESPLTSASAPKATGDAKSAVVTEGPSSTRNDDNAQRPQAQKSWFGLWNTSETQLTQHKDLPTTESEKGTFEFPTMNSSKNDTGANTSPGQARSSWAYWSKASSASTATDANTSHARTSEEMAVAGTASQSQLVPPQLASSNAEISTSTSPRPSSEKMLHKKGKVASDSTISYKSEVAQASSVDTIPKTSDSAAKPATSSVAAAQPNKASDDGTNLLLPDFDKTYHVEDNQTYMEQLTNVLYYREPPRPESHTSLVSVPRKIKKVLAIGVHGYFPIPLFQKVFGPPTGTSIRFAIGAAKAIEAWTRSHNQTCEVEKIALEGEGLVADRVDTLWKLLLNWIDHIRQADFIMFACHSQGVPVTMMLIAKLLQFDCISHKTRMGVCAMAGVNLGPFSSYQSRWIGGAAGQLFDFARTSSVVSRDYTAALHAALAAGVRVLYTGSIDDQLISLESAILSTAHHPYITRAVYIDGRIHAPDFLAHLVGLALKLRNLGMSDHGLIRELSSSLAGSLYGGEGHARIYQDQAVYDLAVRHALETTDLRVNPGLRMDEYETPAANANPYVLPWALRGLLEEEYVKRELSDETKELLRQFDGWKPANKMLKDVKFRLEAVRTML